MSARRVFVFNPVEPSESLLHAPSLSLPRKRGRGRCGTAVAQRNHFARTIETAKEDVVIDALS